MTEDDAGSQHGDGHALLREDPLDLAPAAQVGGELVLVGAQAPEVDDPLDPRLRGRGREVAGRLTVEPLEVG